MKPPPTDHRRRLPLPAYTCPRGCNGRARYQVDVVGVLVCSCGTPMVPAPSIAADLIDMKYRGAP